MTHRDDDTTSVNMINGPGVVTLDKRLEAIEAKLDELLTTHGSTPLRIRALEIVVYGGCALVLVAFVGRQIAIAFTGHP